MPTLTGRQTTGREMTRYLLSIVRIKPDIQHFMCVGGSIKKLRLRFNSEYNPTTIDDV